ncbi:MAG TPA: AMP-binding protein [Streptosporangiaceae bacterium]|jgi:cyclohexanecarboxylate-CoA ligase|nr:AMP-binding protein [Streptosporangiaceae bacterium]
MWDTVARPAPEQAAAYRAAGWWRDETFLDDLARAAATRPGHPAVIAYEDGRLARTLSYADLVTMVNRFAGALADLGVGPGDVVMIHLPNRWMLGPLYLATIRIGAVAAPAQLAMGAREIGHILTETRAKVCVTVGTFAGTDYTHRIRQVAPSTLEHLVVVGDPGLSGALGFDDSFVADQPHRQDGWPAPLGPDDPALLVYTSGTTGQPKGVVHSQNTIYAAGRSLSVPFGLTAADVISIPQLLTHVAGAMHGVYAPITLGATSVMHDTTDDVGLMLDMVAEHQITYLHTSPARTSTLLAEQRARPRQTGSLRVMSASSAPIPPQMVTTAQTLFGVPLCACWGMTETGGCTVTRPDEDPPDWGACSDGCAMPWMQVRIDSEPGARVGRLLVRGASLCLGYLGQRRAFEACLDTDGWFDTGDLARDDGRGGIRICGRRTDLITRASGDKVPTAETEAVLLRHPAVRDVVLVGCRDPRIPECDEVCAVVVPEGWPPTLESLRHHLEQEQVTADSWPDRLEILPELPKNALGKVLRTTVRQLIEAPAADDRAIHDRAADPRPVQPA